MKLQLIRPFSTSLLPQFYEWTRHAPGLVNAKTFTLPQFVDLFTPLLLAPPQLSWEIREVGVAGPVGVVWVQLVTYPGQPSPTDAFIHVGLARRAWGKHVMETVLPQLLHLALTEVPSLLRFSAWVVGANRPITSLCEKMGFVREGVVRDAIQIDGRVRSFNLFGLTRGDFDVLWLNTNQH